MALKEICRKLCYFPGYNRSLENLCYFTSSAVSFDALSYKVAIIGGGAGGATMASRLSSNIGSENVVVIEPSELHYYQPYWTLVGAGIKNINDSCRYMSGVLPKDVKWIKDHVISIDRFRQVLETKNGIKISFEFLIVAMGLNLDFKKIKGLPAAFDTPGVCSNYSVNTVQKTFNALKNFKSGNALFTQPVNPIKCAGAPQKIMYLAEDYFRKHGKREQANVQFFTALGTIFSVPKYAKALSEVAEQKQIKVNYFHNLVEVRPASKEAIFQKVDDGLVSSPAPLPVVVQYEMIHITPPMVAPPLLKESSLADASGFLDVDKFTLQHNKYQSIFGIGDCTNVPTSKTAAAVAAQCGILTQNILSAIKGVPPSAQYDGYTSCPLVTGNEKGILAEFDFDLQPFETFPFDQSKERYLQYLLKKDLLPFVYWNLMLKGYWTGPAIFRKMFHWH